MELKRRFFINKNAFVQNEEEIVQNEEENVEKSLRSPQTFFHFVQNELKIVHLEITPAWGNSSILSHSTATNAWGKQRLFSLRYLSFTTMKKQHLTSLASP